jgi:tetratricopeptide (TPR) repeat protein
LSSIARSLLFALAFLALTPATALADWRRAESQHFVVYSDGSERSLRDYTARLERFHGLLKSRFGGPEQNDTRKLPVYLVGNARALRVAQPHLPEGIDGYYVASENDIFAILIRGQDDDLLLHEYTHHFMANAGQGRLPGWFSEGLAEYYATATVSAAGAATFGLPNPGRLRQLQQGRWLPMDQLLRAQGSFDIENQSARGLYYAQSWALTHWLLADPTRARALGVYLNALNAGRDPVEAWQASFGIPADALEAQLKAYLRGRLYFSELDIPPITPEITVSTLSPAWDAVILPLINARSPRDEETDGPALLHTSRTNAARFPDDALALVALGRAERRWGDSAAAETALSRALEIEPANVEGLLLMADIVEERSDLAPDEAEIDHQRGLAEALLRRALEADPKDYRIYADLARLRRGTGDYPTHDDLLIWAMAARYAPQVMSIRGDAAIAMLRAERYDEAIALLIPIVTDPHGGPGVQHARGLLARIEQMRTAAGPD